MLQRPVLPFLQTETFANAVAEIFERDRTMIRAVFFDIGGTVHTQQASPEWDRTYAQMLRESLSRLGIRTEDAPEKLLEHVGKGARAYKDYAEKTLTELPPDTIWKEFMLRDYPGCGEKVDGHGEELCYQYDRYRRRITERPGLAQTLQALRQDGLRLGVISNIMSRTFVPRILREYGVEGYFETLVLSSVFGVRKPDPAIFDEALRIMRVSKEEAAYVGDTISRDVIGTRKAGWKLMIQIDNPLTYGKDEKYRETGYRPDVRIRELSEIVPEIRKRNQNRSREG
jgi:putative hydrolase of the HAD superfamily